MPYLLFTALAQATAQLSNIAGRRLVSRAASQRQLTGPVDRLSLALLPRVDAVIDERASVAQVRHPGSLAVHQSLQLRREVRVEVGSRLEVGGQQG